MLSSVVVITFFIFIITLTIVAVVVVVVIVVYCNVWNVVVLVVYLQQGNKLKLQKTKQNKNTSNHLLYTHLPLDARLS